jgi:hypothetical protein
MIQKYSAAFAKIPSQSAATFSPLRSPFAPSGRNTASAGIAGRITMRGLFSRIVAGIAPVAAIACAISLAGAFAAPQAEARERPQGDWHRYCKDVDIRGDWLEADCRKHGGGWRRNTRINFDNCPGNEVTVRDGHLVCERRYGGYNNGNHNGWGNDHNPHYGWDRRDNDRRDWDRRDWDRRDWDRRDGDRDRNGRDGRRDHDRRDNDRRDGDRDWTKRQDNDRRDGNWNGRRDDDKNRQITRRDQQQQQQQQQQQTQPQQQERKRDADRRDDNNRRREGEEWWKRGAG